MRASPVASCGCASLRRPDNELSGPPGEVMRASLVTSLWLRLTTGASADGREPVPPRMEVIDESARLPLMRGMMLH